MASSQISIRSRGMRSGGMKDWVSGSVCPVRNLHKPCSAQRFQYWVNKSTIGCCTKLKACDRYNFLNTLLVIYPNEINRAEILACMPPVHACYTAMPAIFIELAF